MQNLIELGIPNFKCFNCLDEVYQINLKQYLLIDRTLIKFTKYHLN